MRNVSLIEWCVLVTLGLVCFVVAVGGYVCITQDAYTFGDYLSDLRNIYKLLLTAIVGALGREIVVALDTRNGRARHEPPRA